MATYSPIAAAPPINSFDDWLRNHLLPALILVVGPMLLLRLIHWAVNRWEADADQRIRTAVDRDDVETEQLKRSRAMVQATNWAITALVVIIATSLSIMVIGIPLTTLIAPATVVGVAVGFGAQQVVGDLLAGFSLAEHQFGYGDVIRYGPPGEEDGVFGTVEEMTFRVTKLRTVQGEQVIIPNGSLRQVTNLSKEWSRAVVDLPIAINADLERATAVLRAAAEQMAGDEPWSTLLLGAIIVSGIESFERRVRRVPRDGANTARPPVRGGTRTALPVGAGAQRGRHRHQQRPDERAAAAVSHGFVSWLRGPLTSRARSGAPPCCSSSCSPDSWPSTSRCAPRRSTTRAAYSTSPRRRRRRPLRRAGSRATRRGRARGRRGRRGRGPGCDRGSRT